MTPELLRDLITSHMFNFTTEEELQSGIEQVLKDAEIPYERERRLVSLGTIDFLVDGSIGLEVKIKCSLAEMTRQLHRYAQSVDLSSLVLVTSQMRHELGLPASLNGKPLAVVHLLRNIF